MTTVSTQRVHRLSRFAGAVAVLSLALGVAGTAFAAAPTHEHPVTTLTYLKAAPGERGPLETFIRLNWFAMDRIAVRQGLFRAYRLRRNVDEAGEWDLIVEVDYNDACGYACVATAFEAIRSRHQTRKVDGKASAELGRVLRTDTVVTVPEP